MLFKTRKFEVGRELDLDEPNHEAIIKIVDVSWLPQATSTEVMELIAKATGLAELDEDDTSAAISNYEKMMAVFTPVIPAVCVWWNFVDENGVPFPQPSAFKEDPSGLSKLIPAQLLMYIINACQQDTQLAAERSGIATTIPPVNGRPSNASSSESTTTAPQQEARMENPSSNSLPNASGSLSIVAGSPQSPDQPTPTQSPIPETSTVV